MRRQQTTVTGVAGAVLLAWLCGGVELPEYNPAQQFWITSGGMVPGSLQAEDHKQSQRFTAPLSKTVTHVALFWKTPYNTAWEPPPTYKVGIQGDRDGLPDGQWINGDGRGLVRPTGWDQWHFVPLKSPAPVVERQIYHVVVEWHSGPVDSAHFNNVYVDRPASHVIPLNIAGPDRNTIITDPNLAVLIYSAAKGWTTREREIAVFLLCFDDGACYGQPYCHAYQGLGGKSTLYYRQRIKIDFQDKTVAAIGTMLGVNLDYVKGATDEEKWNKLGEAIHYEISEGETLLGNGVVARRSEIRDHYYNPGPNEDRRFAWYEQPLSKPLTLEKGRTYVISFFSPGSVEASYLVDAPEVRPSVNPSYPCPGVCPFAQVTWGAADSYFERWSARDGHWKDDGKRRDASLRFKRVTRLSSRE
ncbi:MAG: hypothetical protein AAB225_09120 [Acidobacteriota bacterium]